jgi:hypothetical protein
MRDNRVLVTQAYLRVSQGKVNAIDNQVKYLAPACRAKPLSPI